MLVDRQRGDRLARARGPAQHARLQRLSRDAAGREVVERVPREIDREEPRQRRARGRGIEQDSPAQRERELRRPVEGDERQEPRTDAREVGNDRRPADRPENDGEDREAEEKEDDPEWPPPARGTAARRDGDRLTCRRSLELRPGGHRPVEDAGQSRSGRRVWSRPLSSTGRGKFTSSWTVSNSSTSRTPNFSRV